MPRRLYYTTTQLATITKLTTIDITRLCPICGSDSVIQSNDAIDEFYCTKCAYAMYIDDDGEVIQVKP